MRLDYLQLKQIATDNAETDMRMQNYSIKSNSKENCKYVKQYHCSY